MSDALNRLVAIVPPPPYPVDCGGAGAFKTFEDQLGLSLPADYKQYIRTYGSGAWHDGFWWIFNPFAENEHANLIVQSQNRRPKKWSMLYAERATRQSENGYPHAIYPEPGGILAWARTINGGKFFWETKGRPSSWKTVYYPSRDPDYVVHDLRCVEILLGVVTGQLPLFAEPFSDHEIDHGTPYDFAAPNAFVPMKPKRKRGAIR